jgi:Ulp1 family protease
MARLLLSYAQAAATRVKTVLPLSEADRVRADEVRASTPRGAVLYSSPLCEVSGEKVQALRDGGWLNDDLVNGYMSLVLDRARAEYGNAPAAAASPRCSVPPRQRLRVHAFSSGFFTQLLRGGRYDYAGVARWSKRQRVAIHELDLLLVPCHVNGNHWTLCAADFRRGVVAYLDSLGGRPALYGEALARYLRDEAAKIDDPAAAAAAAVREWRVTFPAGPAQENCFDCGVFVCQAAKALAQGTPLAPDDDEDAAPKELRLLDSLYGRRRAPPAWSPPYGQADMRALRQRMALEFAARKLL